MWAKIWLPLVIMTVSLALSFLFSCSELVFTSVNQMRLEREANEGGIRAAKALKVARKFDQNIAVILLGNGLVNITASSMATLIGLILFEATLGPSNAALLASAIIFLLVVSIGEITPKTLGRRYSYRLSFALTPFVNFFRIVFAPIVFIVGQAVKLIEPLWKRRQKPEQVTEDELVEMVDTIEAEGIIDEKQGDLLRSAITFADTDAFEAMTPRVDVFAFNLEDDVMELLDNPNTFTYSRIPVYEETIDNIIGILPTKLLYPYVLSKERVDIRSLLVKPIFVPHGKEISAILNQFKETHQHIAVVIDEYGGTEGVITLEDIVEEIVGEIWDENDEVLEPVVKVEPDVFIIEGSMHIEDFLDQFDYQADEESDYATVGGWCQERLGRFGVVGDEFDYQHLHITVIEADEFTIERIRVEVRSPSESSDEEE
jgi:CBS domain containing-hemolysin-like protein